MSSDQNHLPLDQPLTIEIDEEKAVVPMTSSSEPLSSPGFHSCDLLDAADVTEEMTVASAVSSDKARLRQLSSFLEKWVSQNNNNLYPSRNEKEQLAKRMSMTYIQVNRWFANRRRKVIKRTKAAPSPATTTTPAEPAVFVDGRQAVSILADQLSAFLHAALSAAAQPAPAPATPAQKTAEEMVMQSSDSPLTPPADDQMGGYSQVVPEMSQYAAEAMALQKLLGALPQLQAYNPSAVMALLPALGINPLQLYQAQLQLAQQQIIQHQLQAQYLAAQQQAQLQQQQQHQLWNGSISASPAHISDSEISEMSELSPPPMSSQMPRPHSPFKDPHGIADTDMLALMSLSKLSEREQQAVNILMELGMDGR